MTMQVAMVGADGIVLASDTKYAYTPDGDDGPRHTYASSKIKINRDASIAVAFARNMDTSSDIADAVIAGLTDKDWMDGPTFPIQRVAQKVVDSTDRKDAQCLIVSARPSLALFKLDVGTLNGERNRAHCWQIGDKAIAGDNHNPAIFWSERYWGSAPIKHLIPIVAHLIISAKRFNSGGIEGLEIVACDGGGVRRLSDESILELESKSKEWDEHIGALFAGYSQQFTYAPARLASVERP
jgi:hypothetical protein